MKRVKVLHILSSRTYNGAENVVCQIHAILRTSNPEIDIIYCSPDGTIRESLKKRRVYFAPVAEMSCREIKRVIQKNQPDVIHAHDMRASFMAAMVCGRIPLISHIHNNDVASRKLSLKSILYLFAALKSKHIFWVSQSAFQCYRFSRLIASKSEILVNIIDIQALRQTAAEGPEERFYDVVYLGRISYPKDPLRLLCVLEKAIKMQPELTAAIVGEGEDLDEVMRQIQSRQLQNNVFCLGFRTNPYRLVQNSKVMLMTSLWEGTPMCALEALALGVPIVSTPVDGLCDLIQNGENGFLSSETDELAERCVEIVSDERRHSYLSEAAKKTAEELMDKEYYRSRIVAAYQKAYIQ